MAPITISQKAKTGTYVFAQSKDKKHSRSVTIHNATPAEVIALLESAVAAKHREQTANAASGT